MISENRELGGKKGDPCMLVAGRKKKKSLSVQTVQMNWEVLCCFATESLSSHISGKINITSVLLNPIFRVPGLINEKQMGNICQPQL